MLLLLAVACTLFKAPEGVGQGGACDTAACAAGLTCVTRLAGAERRSTCEAPCDETPDCPDGQICVTHDEVGRVCVDRMAL
jgi:hypothetical protein